MTILRDEDLAFWNENGYVVIPDAVPGAGTPDSVPVLCVSDNRI